MAHIALMQHELIEKRKWMSNEEFIDYVGITNLIPGPNSTEMTMHCGYHRVGTIGSIVAGLSFIMPASIITLGIAYFADQALMIDGVLPVFEGIRISVISVIVGVLITFTKKIINSKIAALTGLSALLLMFLGISEIVTILLFGVLFIIMLVAKTKTTQLHSVVVLPLILQIMHTVTDFKIFTSFFKIGAVLFGSGYVLFAYLDGELVSNGMLAYDDLMDAVAIGQITPGPILSTATFIGFKLGGISGAAMATIGIFLPAFIYVLLLHRILPLVKKNAYLKSFLVGVNIAAVAAMAHVTLSMALYSLNSIPTWAICLTTMGMYLYNRKISPIIIMVVGGILGYLLLI